MAQAGGSGGGVGRAGRRGAAVVSPPAPAGGAEPGTRPNKLLRLTVVAERLGCSKKTAWRLYRDGAFPGAVMLLGALRVPEAEVLAVAAGGWPASRHGTPRNGTRRG